MSSKPINIVAINGSLRKESVNLKYLKALINHVPEGVEVKILDISKLPLFNQDLEANYPKEAQVLKDEVAASDGVLFVNPEHNRSFTAAMKNAIDWIDRPYGTSAWRGKPGAVTGATGGGIGTFGAQNHLRQVLTMTGVNTMQKPEVYFSWPDHMNEEGEIIDDGTHTIINEFWEAFIIWINRFND